MVDSSAVMVDSSKVSGGPVPAKITNIESIPVHVPFYVPLQIASGGPRPVSEVLIVRIKTDQGIEGIGETQAWRRQGSAETLTSIKYAVDKLLAPEIVGKSPFALPTIAQRLDEVLYSSLYAKAAILDALLDLQGKLLGVPVHALLGGKARNSIGACAVLPIQDDLGATLDRASELYERGFRTVIIKVGLDAAADVRNIAAIRKRVPDMALRIDANASMGFEQALSLLKKVEVFDIQAAEQMVAAWDIDGMSELARRTIIPMLADECLSSDHDLLDLIKARAAGMIQTKIGKNGGIWNCRKLWTIAKAAGIGICPGNHPCAGIATAAAAHLAAAWDGPLLDGPFAIGVGGFLNGDVVVERFQFKDGRVLVRDEPGLGVTIDEGALRRMRADA